MQQTNTQSEQKQALLGRAAELFSEFRSAYLPEWQRLTGCEQMYRGNHWYDVPVTDPNEPRPVTPVIQSTIENISADLMDRIPMPVIAPESRRDREAARVIEAVILQNHDAACYAREYRNIVHDLLVGGYCVQEVGYDPEENGGLGGAFIRHTDIRNILFDPLAADLQEGRAVFKIKLATRRWLEERYPEHAPFLGDDGYRAADAAEDPLLAADKRNSMLLLEYWWREYDAENDRYAVHMALIAGNRVLRDSRDEKPEGYYAHGKYPFILTALFPRRGSCLGFGIVDLYGTQQRYADKLDQIVLKNALMASHNKLLVTEGSGFDTEDLRDWSKEVHRGESLGGVTWFSTPPLPAYIISYLRELRETIKEDSGANDFSRGRNGGGITAASAIEAMQEMAGKRSRMISRQLHEAFRDAVRMEIEVEREFNYFTRTVHVLIDGELCERSFESTMLEYDAVGGVRLPIEFCIKVRAQQEMKYSAASQNELALKMLAAGILTPYQAAEMMSFDGKEQVLRELNERKGTLSAAMPQGVKSKEKMRQ